MFTDARSAVLSSPIPLASVLQLDRLEHRARRLTRVIDALRERMRAHERAAGSVPMPLRLAVDGFEHELRAVRRDLAVLPRSVVANRQRAF